MKNYTFTADEASVEMARKLLEGDNKSLQQGFREWVDQLARNYRVKKHDEFFESVKDVSLKYMPSREERNAR